MQGHFYNILFIKQNLLKLDWIQEEEIALPFDRKLSEILRVFFNTQSLPSVYKLFIFLLNAEYIHPSLPLSWTLIYYNRSLQL